MNLFFLPKATKAHIELDVKNLYRADGNALKELLKITSAFRSIMKTAERADVSEEESSEFTSDFDSKVRKTRTLVLGGKLS